MNRLLLSLIATALSGCTLIPSLKRPPLPVADTWCSLPPAEPRDCCEKPISCLSWQEFFRCTAMREIIAAALQHNRDLRIAALNVEAAGALYRIERANLYPFVDMRFKENRQQITEAQSINNSSGQAYISSTYTANVAITDFELDVFGKLRSQSASALETYFSTRAAQDAVRMRLIAEVANAYLQWLADCEILNLTERTLAAQERSYELVAERQKNGIASQLELSQARTTIETAKANRALYQRMVMQDKNALILLTGLKETDCRFVNQPIGTLELPSTLPDCLSSTLLLLRPDVREAEHALKSANADIGAARAAFFPTITLTGHYGFASSELSDLFSGRGAGAWNFAPEILAPLFRAGRNRANLRYSEARKNLYIAQYERAIQTAFKEVADELAARQTLHPEWEAQTRLVKALEETYDLSYARYKEGVDGFINVLDAQKSLFEAQKRQVQVHKQCLANLVNLYKALGIQPSPL